MDADDVHERWSDRSRAYSPDYYAYYGPNDTSELLRRTLEDAVGTDASILELGCSSGRHLAHLLEHGFEDLAGIDINDEAFEVMGRAYPDLADVGTFYVDPLERVVPTFDDGEFDAVFSVETLQHVHPAGERVFADLVEATAEMLVTVENEGDDDGVDGDGDDDGNDGDRESTVREVRNVDGVPLYVRDWNDVFTAYDLEQVASASLERDTFRAFRPTGE